MLLATFRQVQRDILPSLKNKYSKLKDTSHIMPNTVFLDLIPQELTPCKHIIAVTANLRTVSHNFLRNMHHYTTVDKFITNIQILELPHITILQYNRMEDVY